MNKHVRTIHVIRLVNPRPVNRVGLEGGLSIIALNLSKDEVGKNNIMTITARI
jgi:hypothetical protein